jgi:hypothetical protein
MIKPPYSFFMQDATASKRSLGSNGFLMYSLRPSQGVASTSIFSILAVRKIKRIFEVSGSSFTPVIQLIKEY